MAKITTPDSPVVLEMTTAEGRALFALLDEMTSDDHEYHLGKRFECEPEKVDGASRAVCDVWAALHNHYKK